MSTGQMHPGMHPIDGDLVLPYYRMTNPAMAHNARHVIRAVLDEG